MSETRFETSEAFTLPEGELHTFFLCLADQATVFEIVCEGLLFAGQVVPVRSYGVCGYFWGDEFAEEVAVQEDSFVFLYGIRG